MTLPIVDITHGVIQDIVNDIVPTGGVEASLRCSLPLTEDLSSPQVGADPTLTRSTTGTFIDRDDRLLKTAAINVARFEANGILLEGESTNELTDSEDFTGTDWSTIRSSITSDAVTGPDGTTLADKLVEDATAASTHVMDYDGSISITSGNLYAASIFVKAAERSELRILLDDLFFPALARVDVDLSISTVTAGSGANTVSIIVLPDGWSRIDITATADATGTSTEICRFFLRDAGNNSYNGDGVSGLYVLGAQFEGLPFATSYIPTFGAIVTREADVFAIDADCINVANSSYSVFVNADTLGDLDTGASGRFIYDVAGETLRDMRIWSNNVAVAVATSGDSVGDRITGTAPVGDNLVNYTVTYDSGTNTLEFFEDAVSQGSDNTVDAVTGTKTGINIGSTNTNNFLYGHLKNLRIYDTPLTSENIRDLGIPTDDAPLLLETGVAFLLENGDKFLLE